MADQTNRVTGTVDIQTDSDGRVAFDMVKYYAAEAGLNGQGAEIDDIARLFAMFLSIMKTPSSIEDHIKRYNKSQT
ncbi:MAG: hypothetical protein KDJ88_16425 [Bauldia sp.]|nr:hypothetical protein [Bauldia sp.]